MIEVRSDPLQADVVVEVQRAVVPEAGEAANGDRGQLGADELAYEVQRTEWVRRKERIGTYRLPVGSCSGFSLPSLRWAKSSSTGLPS